MLKNKYIFLCGTVAAFFGIALAYWMQMKRKDEEFEEDDERDTHIGNGDNSTSETAPDKDVLVLGLQNSGKTALLEGLSGNNHLSSKPTDGFNIVSLPGPKDSRHNFVELGGGEKPRKYWRHFYRDKCLLVFVVDASRKALFSEAKDVLHELLNEPFLKDLSVILVAHKQDVNGASDGDEVLKAMDVKSFTKAGGRNIYPVQTQTPPHSSAAETKELESIINSLL